MGRWRHPDQEWMEQIALNSIPETWGYLNGCRYVLHIVSVRAGGRWCEDHGASRQKFESEHCCGTLGAVRQEEYLSKLILFGEGPLSRTLAEFRAHYHGERNDQRKGNKLLFPDATDKTEVRGHAVECRQRLGGLLKFYARAWIL